MTQDLVQQARAELIRIFRQPCDQPLVIVVGVCNPFIVQGLRQNLTEKQTVIVVDVHKDEQLAALQGVFYFSPQEREQFLQLSKAVLQNAPELRYRLIVDESSPDSDRTAILQSIAQDITVQIPEIIRHLTGYRYRQELQFHNFMANLPFVFLGRGIGCLKGIAEGKTVAVIGAGPSLKNHLTWLREHRPNLFLIAAGSVAGGLVAHDIHPDLYVETDHRAPTPLGRNRHLLLFFGSLFYDHDRIGGEV